MLYSFTCVIDDDDEYILHVTTCTVIHFIFQIKIYNSSREAQLTLLMKLF